MELDGRGRRAFLQLLGLGLATACRPPREPILPYVRQPEEVHPGEPVFYATSMAIDGYAIGLLAESREGRPTRIEGNPEHPASLGAVGLHPQASILELYDPHRARLPRGPGGPLSWAGFVRRFGAAQTPALPVRGEGIHFVLPPTSSPLVASLIERVRLRFPGARFHCHAPLDTGAVRQASRAAYGRELATQRHFDRAEAVVAIDADFLGHEPFGVRWSHDFARTRRVREAGDRISRLWVAEPELTLTGAVADRRVRVRPSELPALCAALAAEVLGGERVETPHRSWVEAAARDLLRHRGRSIVLAGERLPAEAHVLVHAMDEALGNVGSTVVHTRSPLLELEEMPPLFEAIDDGQVGTLVLLEVDPVRDAFADDRFGERLARVPQSIALGLREDETGQRCTFFLPAAHWLESWGDGRAYDGTLTFTQPLIRPLFDGHSTAEVLAVFAGLAEPDGHALLRELHPDLPLARGFVPGSAFAPETAEVRAEAVREAMGRLVAMRPGGKIELSLRPDCKLHGGAFARVDWLLELPDPLTRLCWENAALLSPRTARRLGVEAGDLLEIRVGDRVARVPAFPFPGTAEETVSITLGWGAYHAGEKRVVGFDAAPLRTRAAPWFAEDVAIERVMTRNGVGAPVPERVRLASAQPHLDMRGRPILLHATLDRFRADPEAVVPREAAPLSLYPVQERRGPQWAMSIDLSTCTGCASCVIACQAENNVPVVGKEAVANGREMHWLRIDRYLLGSDEENVLLLPQPMLCQHCEKAPCEYVCPVNATVHSPDGLNEMVYNRCIGTRFCSNNCPYKVRRFNYLEYNALTSDLEKMQKNPAVTIRARGVMEKCTFCVQRIRGESIRARIENRPLRRIRTACEAVCPTGAIVFGDLADPESEVALLHGDRRSYALLDHELGTRPRVRYLAHLAAGEEAS